MLPIQYQWLANEPGPKLLVEMLKLFGTLEKPGAGDNATIIAWGVEINVGSTYSHDSIPWCGLAVGVAAKRAGKEIPKTPLWALAWADFGVAVEVPMLGDILTFKRKTPDGKVAGHVGVYVGEDDEAYHVLAGNQSDQVNIARIVKSRLYRARRPIYLNQPANVRRVMLASSGRLSANEA